MKVEVLKVEDGIIEPLGGNDMPACMTGCGGTVYACYPIWSVFC